MNKRRVVFVTQDEPLYLPHYLDRILSAGAGKFDVVRVLVLPLRLPRKTQFETYLYFIFEFYGVILATYLAMLRVWFWIGDAFRAKTNGVARLHSRRGGV